MDAHLSFQYPGSAAQGTQGGGPCAAALACLYPEACIQRRGPFRP